MKIQFGCHRDTCRFSPSLLLWTDPSRVYNYCHWSEREKHADGRMAANMLHPITVVTNVKSEHGRKSLEALYNERVLSGNITRNWKRGRSIDACTYQGADARQLIFKLNWIFFLWLKTEVPCHSLYSLLITPVFNYVAQRDKRRRLEKGEMEGKKKVGHSSRGIKHLPSFRRPV